MIAVSANFVLVCGATGFPPPTITWALNGTTLTNGSRVFIQMAFEGFEFMSMLTVMDADQNDSGTYTCSADNDVGDLDEATGYVTVRGMQVASICN